jgi:hypothetical protein
VDTVIPLVGKVDGCTTEIIKASLVLAENQKFRIDGVTGEAIDFEKQLRDIKAQREAEAAAQAEQERLAGVYKISASFGASRSCGMLCRQCRV